MGMDTTIGSSLVFLGPFGGLPRRAEPELEQAKPRFVAPPEHRTKGLRLSCVTVWCGSGWSCWRSPPKRDLICRRHL